MMEIITINEIEVKPTGLVIVKYLGDRDAPVLYDNILEATMNTKWQAQEGDYLEKDVGIGGSVEVLIEKKQSKETKVWYTNITKVNFESAQKGATSDHHNPNENGAYPTGKGENAYKGDAHAFKVESSYTTDERITAAVILKGAVEIVSSGHYNMDGTRNFEEEICAVVNELTGAYKLALSNVKGL